MLIKVQKDFAIGIVFYKEIKIDSAKPHFKKKKRKKYSPNLTLFALY